MNRLFFHSLCRRISSSSATNGPVKLMANFKFASQSEQYCQIWKPKIQLKDSSLRNFSINREQLVWEVGSEDDFDEIVYHSDKPVIVQFYADWCGPCQNLAPRLDAKVTGQQGKIILVKVNVESGSIIAERFNVQAVPTVLCFKDGEIVHSFQGDVDDAYLDQIMANLMLKDEGLYKNPSGRIVEEDEEKDKIF